MSSFYEIPVINTHWGWREYLEALFGLFLPHRRGVDSREELTHWFQTSFGRLPLLVNSGRAALEIALLRIRKQKILEGRSQVVVPSLICPCVPRKIRAAGFEPVFYDMDYDVSPRLQDAIRAAGAGTTAILFPYLYGKVTDVSVLVDHCRANNQFLIEDCASSFLLSDSTGVLTGTRGDYAIFSFANGKTVNVGGGGVLVDRVGGAEEDLALPRIGWGRVCRAKIFFVANYILGSLAYPALRLLSGPSTLAEMAEELHPMAAVDARLILAQMRRWCELQRQKQHVLERYAANLADYPELSLPQYAPGKHLNRLYVQFPGKVMDRITASYQSAPIVTFLRSRGIQVQAPYFPAHLLPEFANCPRTDLYWTERLYNCLIEVPSQPGLKDDQVDYVCESLVSSLGFLRTPIWRPATNKGVMPCRTE